MKLIQHQKPFYILEIPFLISRAANYLNDSTKIFEISKNEFNQIDTLYPGYFQNFELLVQEASSILENHQKILDIHKLLPLGTFTELIYHVNTLDFKDINLQNFTQSALMVLFDRFTEDGIETAHENIRLSHEILRDESFDFKLFLKQFNTFDMDDSSKFKILEYFNDVEAVFEEYKILHNKLLDIYMSFYENYKYIVSDNAPKEQIADLNLERFIDVNSFKSHSSKSFHFSYSLIFFRSLTAKLAVVEEELSFGMQGVFASLLDEIEKDNMISINSIEQQMSALGDNKRIRIFELLLEEEHYLKELADELELSSSTLSHHMDILQSAGLVKMRAKGKRIYYSINLHEINSIVAFFQKVANSLEEST